MTAAVRPPPLFPGRAHLRPCPERLGAPAIPRSAARARALEGCTLREPCQNARPAPPVDGRLTTDLRGWRRFSPDEAPGWRRVLRIRWCRAAPVRGQGRPDRAVSHSIPEGGCGVKPPGWGEQFSGEGRTPDRGPADVAPGGRRGRAPGGDSLWGSCGAVARAVGNTGGRLRAGPAARERGGDERLEMQCRATSGRRLSPAVHPLGGAGTGRAVRVDKWAIAAPGPAARRRDASGGRRTRRTALDTGGGSLYNAALQSAAQSRRSSFLQKGSGPWRTRNRQPSARARR